MPYFAPNPLSPGAQTVADALAPPSQFSPGEIAALNAWRQKYGYNEWENIPPSQRPTDPVTQIPNARAMNVDPQQWDQFLKQGGPADGKPGWPEWFGPPSAGPPVEGRLDAQDLPSYAGAVPGAGKRGKPKGV